MEFSTHYLLMADHAMLQKLVMSRIKPLGLTTGQPKVLDFLQDHDGAMQKDIAKGCHIEPSSLSTILGGKWNAPDCLNAAHATKTAVRCMSV